MEEQKFIILESPDMLIARVDKMRKLGYRLGQACVVTKADDVFDVLYSFAKDDELVNLRLLVPAGTEVESIGSIYPYAFLYENEMRDLYGIDIRNIDVDFKGALYQTTITHPCAENDGAAKE